MEETEHSENIYWVPGNISESRILDNTRNIFSTKPVPNLPKSVKNPEGDLNMVSSCVVRD